MRSFLDRLYWLSGVLAAFFLAAIFVIVIVQVGANTIDRLAGLLFGRAIGLAIPSYADFAGFFLATTSFLGLAATLRKGALIRVSLLIQRFHGRTRQFLEIWCTGTGSFIAGYATFYSVELAMESYHYNDLSTGIIAVPLWIPQSAMILGLAILTIALTDELVAVLRGEEPAYSAAGDALLVGGPADDDTGQPNGGEGEDGR
jgi:TRAP-type C4-dicarboxylate transport system permease small subunit